MIKTLKERQQDAEANMFAMCLLMDEDDVRRELTHLLTTPDRDISDGLDLVDDPAIEQLAKRFGVSEQMITIRLCQLGYFDF